jgi:hypothetical protein
MDRCRLVMLRVTQGQLSRYPEIRWGDREGRGGPTTIIVCCTKKKAKRLGEFRSYDGSSAGVRTVGGSRW